ncbi:MAG: archaeosortase/exosortase family protein [Verrucomicrobiota bacterium]|nr:archaeosortase/exosortase family protein [Verrucomicrobiota bacterium]
MPIRKQLVASFRQKYCHQDFWLHCLLLGLLVTALWPLTVWFAQTAYDQSRILHALAVLCIASVLIVRFGGIKVSNPLEMNPSAQRALLAAYVFLIICILGKYLALPEWIGLVIVPAYCCALAAGMRFVLGENTQKLTRTLATTLLIFLLLSIYMEPMDWPLRSFAGQWSSHILDFLGQSSDLRVASEGSAPPMLLLVVNEFPFHVASECNGFGVILTSLLVSLLLAIHRGSSIPSTSLQVLVGAVIGFAFNVIRIVIIVLLAPTLMQHYQLMHEIVGGITYWSSLVVIWILLNGPTQSETI